MTSADVRLNVGRNLSYECLLENSLAEADRVFPGNRGKTETRGDYLNPEEVMQSPVHVVTSCCAGIHHQASLAVIS